jgi:hypothetical protein
VHRRNHRWSITGAQVSRRRRKAAVGAAEPGRSSIGGVLEAVYLTLLCLSALMIAWFAVFVVYRLFKGQR